MAVTVHERPVGATVEWYTPPSLFDALRLDFDLDPASPGAAVVPWVPAARHLTRAEDGLAHDWTGRVWLNPPYGRDLPDFVWRMVKHGDGMLLVAARTETQWFQYAAKHAAVVTFLRDRLHFIRADGLQARSSFASALLAYGNDCAAALWMASLGWSTKAGWDRTIAERAA